MQFQECWSTRPSKGSQGWSRQGWGRERPALLMRAPTPWTPSSGSWTPSTRWCASMAWTQSWSNRWSSRCSTSSGLWHSITCSCARTCARGAKECRSGGKAWYTSPECTAGNLIELFDIAQCNFDGAADIWNIYFSTRKQVQVVLNWFGKYGKSKRKKCFIVK